MLKNVALTAAVACSMLALTGQTNAQKDDGGIAGVGIAPMTTTRVASNLIRPIYATFAPGDPDRLFIIEKQGRIRILRTNTTPNTLVGTPFLDIDSIITGGTTTGSEQGLLGLAFDPNYETNGFFYVYYTALNSANTVARYQVSANPEVANPASAFIILSIADPEANHNGGWMAFGPDDGYLYVATGDGGGGNDQHGTFGNGQNLLSLFGKMLRLDPDGPDDIYGTPDDDAFASTIKNYAIPPSNPFVGITGEDEIWAYGLRNPWRNAFDRLTGDLYIADVGQNAWEEVNFQAASTGMPGDVGYQGGKNYGWRCMEGNHCTGLTGCTCELNCPGGPLSCPITEYAHGGTPFKCSITGGYVYRGTVISGLQGTYWFADYNCGAAGAAPIFSIVYTGAANPPVTNRTTELAPGGGLVIDSITSFAEDFQGELYICDQDGGEIFKIIPSIPPAPANNTCANASVAIAGPNAFTTVNATTDGPDEGTPCDFNGVTQISNDVWFVYAAQCTGTATVSLCNATFNSKLAIYSSTCPAAPGASLACADDTCGDDPEVSFPVTSNGIYHIRIGGVSGATGTGSLVVTCTEPPSCPADIAGGDGEVNVDDLLAVINAWGTCPVPPGKCAADINDDSEVNVDDLLAVINGWGSCP